MRVHRIYLENLLEGENPLSKQEAYHLARVLRVRVGHAIQAFDGKGYYANGTVKSVNKNKVRVELASKKLSEVEAERKITLAVGLPKGDAFETIVRMGTELGVVAFMPLLTEYSEVRMLKDNKLERYRRIALEATKQSGRSLIPHIHPLHSINELLSFMQTQPPHLNMVAHPYSQKTRIDISIAPHKNILGITGAEGGLSQTEIEKLTEIAQFVNLGKRILRADTAPLVLATQLIYDS